VGAGTIEAILAVTPMETIKTKLIERNMNMVAGVTAIVKEEGMGGLYQGVFATILKQSSNQGLRFMFFNTYKDYLSKTYIYPLTSAERVEGEHVLTPWGALAGGMAAGCFSTLGNNPFDVVKTQMQGANAKMYKGTMDCFLTIMKQGGPAAFYKGCLARMGRVVPGQGIIFMCFSTIERTVAGYF
jgi:solute carrier family 25 (mitochondrial citrate transporter), member 1